MKQIGSPIKDNRIKATNYLFELTLQEYYDMSINILKNNEYQRNRVKSSSTVYSLLRDDLEKGCVIPPIVLAIPLEYDPLCYATIEDFIKANKNSVVILDGLQRSMTIKNIVEQNQNTLFANENMAVLEYPIRVEIYVGIDKLGILYRMLTLNTGQTPMSARHQIEILYSGYIENSNLDNIKFIKETDSVKLNAIGEYKFKDVIDGFTSYLDRDYLTIIRADILDNIKSLEKLSLSSSSRDLFDDFIVSYNNFMTKANNLFPVNISESDYLIKKTRPFGNNIMEIFNKSQALTGYGSALGKLVDSESILSIIDINNIQTYSNIDNGLIQIVEDLDKIQLTAKKIGNDQRYYFHYFFRSLFNSNGESYTDFLAAAKAAYKHYEREIL